MLPPPPRNGGATAGVAPANTTTINNGATAAAAAADWQERERRQRSVRMLMLFLFCLLLMDEEPDAANLRGGSQRRHQRQPLEPAVFTARRDQDSLVRKLLQEHPRYTQLVEQYNQGIDRNVQVEEWSSLHADMVKDEFYFDPPNRPSVETENGRGDTAGEDVNDPEANTKVWHYPWNTTGFYRGDWKLIHPGSEDSVAESAIPFIPLTPIVVDDVKNKSSETILPAIALERSLTSALLARNESVGIVMLPDHLGILTREDHNLTGFADQDSGGNQQTPQQTVSLTRPLGRAALQLYARHVPTLRELSLVDGFIKLYDNTSPPGYSTRKDMLLRVRGVQFHSIGRLSLVANLPVEHMALVLASKDVVSLEESTTTTKRRLVEAAESNVTTVGWSNHVLPFPFVPDDKDESIRQARTQASHTLLSREQALERNAAGCAFEIKLDISPVEWSLGEWRKQIVRRIEEVQQLNPFNRPVSKDENDETGTVSSGGSGSSSSRSNSNHPHGRRRQPVHDQAVAMHLTGTIHSPSCNFTAVLNTTAIRTDWDATTSKSINYSFYLMLVCLSQILLLLRQLLHSQSPSTATRVSLVCIGWHTMIDALLCLAHIYLSLAVPPLFTAFASVAFFKLLIFCVIEMKYMAMIVQARNSSSGGQPANVLRRQVAMLHLRFYVALLASFLVLYYADHKYRSWSMLLLYSFWVPQIVWNVITEARHPMHKYYIIGMSLTRLVAPSYIFCVKNNFLKEVYPDSPTDPSMMIKVCVWVIVQAAILLAQGKYGARCMIPARFLPPKFDYNRPLPASMLPPDALDNPTPELIEDRDSDPLRASSSSPLRSSNNAVPRHNHATTTRNRHNKSSGLTRKQNATMMMEEHKAPVSAPTMECSICYEAIDVRDRQNYMLGPCNHLFHKECLAQWMEVKMECPICRTELPAL